MRVLNLVRALVPALVLAAPLSAMAQGELVVYCTVQEEWCRPMVQAFEKATGVKVSMTRKSSGEFYAQIKAEAANPKGDIWWGGTGDPHLQAAEEGLTEPYKSPKMGELQDWAVRQWEASKGRTVGVYAGALGYSYNNDQMKKNRVPAEMIIYPGEGHGVRQVAHQKDLLEREIAWFERWVTK